MVVRTEDGGATWRDFSPPLPAGQRITAATFGARDRAWALAAATDGSVAAMASHIWWTEDAGASWREGPDLGPYALGQMTFARDGRQGWFAQYRGANAGTDLAIFRSADSGLTWRLVSVTVPDDRAAQSEQLPVSCAKSLTILDGGHGFAAAACPQSVPWLFRTADGASTWQRVVLPAPGDPATPVSNCGCGVASVAFPPGNDGFALVTGGLQTVYATHDAGQSWQAVAYPAGGSVAAMEFVDRAHGWLWGARDLFATSDGGRSWTLVSQVLDGGPVSFSTPDDGWAWLRKGRDGSGHPVLAHSMDGGRTWR